MFKLIIILGVVGAAFAAPGLYNKQNVSIHNNVAIIGGHATDISKHPWQVSFQYMGQHFCGGFLISSNWVVTAAHCLTQGYRSNINIRAGSTINTQGGESIAVSKYIVHPDYNDADMNKDIALLYLAKSVTVANARAAKLPSAGQEVPDNAQLTVTGWGSTKENGAGSRTLQEVTVPTINRQVCARANMLVNRVTEYMFCAGLLNTGGKDSCQGDSGGPASINGVVVGVVSWGHGCARANYPGVYTQVSKVRSWITQNTGI